jgi:pyruvate/2-oxoglutarate dehydrogenase complex dihydrolipoamide dehydrogenase (E3) component
MTNTERYDAVVIGTGQGGKPLSIALAKAGFKTAVIERKYIGGTCINVGCTPTKTMVASGRVAYLAGRGANYGVNTGSISVDLARVRQRKQAVVDSFRNGGLKSIESTDGLNLLMGEARFIGPKSLEVSMNGGGTRLVNAEKIFINTGGRPSAPPIPGLDSVPTLDSTSIMELDAVPEGLLVLGGGYIGLEFAQLFRRFGSRVTVVHRGRHLLSREDPDVADEVATILRQDGIEVLLETVPVKVEKGENGDIHLTVRTSLGERSIAGSHMLLAVGRVPNTDRLNLEAAGVQTDKGGFVVANDKLETTAPGVYAIGDVKGGPQFTHISYDDFRVLRTNVIEGGSASISGRLVPYTVFIDPQLGRVGMNETEARESGRAIRVARLPMAHVARAIEMDETRGFMKVVLDANTNEILGCAILGIEGGELMAMFQIAMMGRLPYTVLKEAIFAHPTLAEGLNNLFLALDS